MNKNLERVIEIPEGISCEFNNDILKCRKGDVEIVREVKALGTQITAEANKITFLCKKANKKSITLIKSQSAHVRNMFKGLSEKFKYELEVVYVHFPITVKKEGNGLVISNFLGEKVNRFAKIIDGVDVEVKGQNITVSCHDLEKAGQTSANIEKATRISKRDRRIFQDGCFIVKKPRGEV